MATTPSTPNFDSLPDLFPIKMTGKDDPRGMIHNKLQSFDGRINRPENKP